MVIGSIINRLGRCGQVNASGVDFGEFLVLAELRLVKLFDLVMLDG